MRDTLAQADHVALSVPRDGLAQDDHPALPRLRDGLARGPCRRSILP